MFTERDQSEKSVLSPKTVVVGVLVLGNCLVGVGSMPLYTLAIPWIDENLPKRVSAVYVGKKASNKNEIKVLNKFQNSE